jgi:hypothetical protein
LKSSAGFACPGPEFAPAWDRFRRNNSTHRESDLAFEVNYAATQFTHSKDSALCLFPHVPGAADSESEHYGIHRRAMFPPQYPTHRVNSFTWNYIPTILLQAADFKCLKLDLQTFLTSFQAASLGDDDSSLPFAVQLEG